ncbi:MAG: hypothetical protein LBV44_02280 [Methylobacillus sp.]|jgi:hypothetical protein|nr:hypothetical protein [Methylobacillus sp.]
MTETLKNIFGNLDGLFDLSQRAYAPAREGFQNDARNLSNDFLTIGNDLKKKLADEQRDARARQK